MEWTDYFSPEPQFAADFGDALCVHDFNQDGFDDLLALEPFATVEGVQQAGRGWILYGPTLTTWLEFHASEPVKFERLGSNSDLFDIGSGETCWVGDVNGDGESDILVGARDYENFVGVNLDWEGRAHLFYGPDFSQETVLPNPRPEAKSRFGSSVMLLDVTGDGRDDVFVGAPWASAAETIPKAGQVYFWDASDLATPSAVPHDHPLAGSLSGTSLRWAFMDSDQVPDLLIGEEGFQVCCPLYDGRVHVASGADHQDNWTIPSPVSASTNFGDAVHAGDLTGDLIQDLVVKAWNSTLSPCSGSGKVLLLAGPDFTTVAHTFVSPKPCDTNSFFFGLNTVVADVDRDGSQDVIVADTSGPSVPGAHVFYGPTFSTVQGIGGDITSGLGTALAVGDLDGDGWLELIVPAAFTGLGAVYVFDVQTLLADVAELSLSSGGTATFSLNAGPSQSGNSYVGLLSVSGSDPGVIPQPGVFVPLNVDAVTFAGLALLSSPVLPGFLGQLDADGKASFALQLPPGAAPSLVGQTLTVAAVTIEPGGHLGIGSSAVEIALEP